MIENLKNYIRNEQKKQRRLLPPRISEANLDKLCQYGQVIENYIKGKIDLSEDNLISLVTLNVMASCYRRSNRNSSLQKEFSSNLYNIKIRDFNLLLEKMVFWKRTECNINCFKRMDEVNSALFQLAISSYIEEYTSGEIIDLLTDQKNLQISRIIKYMVKAFVLHLDHIQSLMINSLGCQEDNNTSDERRNKFTKIWSAINYSLDYLAISDIDPQSIKRMTHTRVGLVNTSTSRGHQRNLL